MVSITSYFCCSYHSLSLSLLFFTQGPLYWVFKDNGVEEGYPRPITDFGLPQGGISGAFSWPSDQKTYFFKGDLHWCYDETTRHIEEASPVLQESWEQFSSVDSVLIESDGELGCGPQADLGLIQKFHCMLIWAPGNHEMPSGSPVYPVLSRSAEQTGLLHRGCSKEYPVK